MNTEIERDYVFISYSQEDKQWLKRLQTMIKPLEKSLEVSFWDDTQLKSGVLRKDKIQSVLTAARVAVLLVSPNFLESNFTAEYQLPQLLEMAKKAGLQIIWICLSDCLYEETRIADYQAAHNISEPLDVIYERSKGELNQILKSISKKIKRAVASQRKKQEIKTLLKQSPQDNKLEKLDIKFSGIDTILIENDLVDQMSKFHKILEEENYSGVFAFITAGERIILRNYIIPRMKKEIESRILGTGKNQCELSDPPICLTRHSINDIERDLEDSVSKLVNSEIKFIFLTIWIRSEVQPREIKNIASSFWESNFLQSVKERFHNENRCLVLIWAKEGTSLLRGVQGFQALTMPKKVLNSFIERIKDNLTKDNLANLTENREFLTENREFIAEFIADFCQSLENQYNDFFSTYQLIDDLICHRWYPSISVSYSNPNEEVNS